MPPMIACRHTTCASTTTHPEGNPRQTPHGFEHAVGGGKPACRNTAIVQHTPLVRGRPHLGAMATRDAVPQGLIVVG